MDSLQLTDIVLSYPHFDKGGNTSVENDSNFAFKWSGESPYQSGGAGYFINDSTEVPYIKRKRDLGQTFTYFGEKPFQISSLILRTGFGTNVVRQNMYGQKVSIQFMEVTGEPQIHENGSDGDTKAFHGFPHHRQQREIPAKRDDYMIGETYKHLKVFRGFKFPDKTDFGFENDDIQVDPNDKRLKGRLLRFNFPTNKRVTIEPDKTYAFMVMIDSLASDVGFTLANNYEGSYENGHGIRREGKGVFPPVPADVNFPITHEKNSHALQSSKLPLVFEQRLEQQPGTNGYPDVDTWRDLNFYLQKEP
ncbi:hypothetical protein GTQ38_01930 [Flavobacteriaceae bacterium R33]|uniref:Uncharacterized protein n=2 Tax=Poritiphilus flavus TaxID=2697053 RepID=A0A6L9E815_9FLAO|nr:hypothetical protein [Poritiphilus flavus]